MTKASITRAQFEALLAEYAISATYTEITAAPRSNALTVVTDDPGRLILDIGIGLGAAYIYEEAVARDPLAPEGGWHWVALAARRVEIHRRYSGDARAEVCFPDLTLTDDE